MTLIYKLYIFVFEPRGVLETTLCDKVCQWLATGRWFSLGPPISSTNKTDHHDIAQIPMKVALDTKKKKNLCGFFSFFFCSRVPTFYLLVLQRMYTCFFSSWYVILQSGLDEVMTMKELIMTYTSFGHHHECALSCEILVAIDCCYLMLTK